MDQVIGLKELRENLAKYERGVKAGKTFIVMKRTKPLFKISPVESEDWEEVVDFTKIQKGGILINELLSRL